MPDLNAKRQESFDEGWYAPIRRAEEAKTWKDLGYRAFQKQLASKERPPRRTASQKSTTTLTRKGQREA
jgi:hypothetical protein